jgi:hypothetical protein
MKKTKLYNNLPDKLLKKMLLKPGEKVVYKLYNITSAPMDPTRLAIPAYRNVPPIDQIYDKESESYIDIAAVKSVDAEGNHTFHDIYFTSQQAGHMILFGGRAVDQEIHSYLSLCNHNASNKDRDTTKEVIFELVDEEAKAEKESTTRNKKRDALNIAADLTPEDVKDYTAALGKSEDRPIKVLRNELEALADRDPEEFLSLINNKQAVMKATINRALAKGAILFSEEQSMYKWANGEAILTVARGTEAIDEFVSFCVSSAKGEKVYQNLQSKSKK